MSSNFPLNRCCLFLFLSFFIYSSSPAQKTALTGKVVSAGTMEPLAFVNIAIKDVPSGTVSDIDGKFSVVIPKENAIVFFSYVGFEQHYLYVTDSLLNLKHLVIKLQPKQFVLREFVVVAGENPAHRIIRKAIANVAINNPEKKGTFSYTSYNKMVFTPQFAGVKEPVNDIDSSEIRLKEFTEKQHLFLMESVSERNFKDGRNNEKIIASRVSGLKNPTFNLLATQMQSFSFYGDYVALSEKKYLNPIGSGSVGRYEFTLEDTVYTANDTVFIISFRPGKGKNFDGMKGLLYINTNLFAIQNVIAEPAQEEPNFHIKIQQKYEFVEGKQWFPVQLNTDITYKIFNVNNHNIVGTGRSYIENIKINPELDKKQFTSVEIEVVNDAGNRADDFWNRYRKDSLTKKETTTYHVIDSLGKAENLDLKLKAFETIMTGKIPAGYVNFDLDKIITFNDYEGFRLGVGTHSSKKLSKIVSIGGYGAYGFKDKAIKYGADLELLIHKRSQMSLKLFKSNDVVEAGGIDFLLDRKPHIDESYRQYLISKMDSIAQSGINLTFKAAQYLKISVSGVQSRINFVGDYQYGTTMNDVIKKINSYDVAEIATGFRFAYREKFMKTPTFTYSLGTTYPVLWFQVIKGFDQVQVGEFDFLRFDVKIEKDLNIKHIGKASLQLIGGHIEGNLPYTSLYAGRGSFKSYSVSVSNTFETMQMNEFLSSSYMSLFFNHNFGNLLFSTENFKPEFVLVSALGWGTLNNQQNHFNVTYKTMEKGFYESGLRINNLISKSIIGMGAGVFYRYGPYASTDEKNNIAVKFTLSFIF